MRACCLASAFILGISPAALAAGADTLGNALEKFPQVILTNPEPVQAYFIDMEVLQAIGRQTDSVNGLANQRMDFAMIDALTPLAMGGVETWERNAGISLGEVRYFAGMGTPPYMVSIWGLSSDTAVSGLVKNLETLDFAPMGSGRVLGNGEPLNVDFTSREIGNPWRDELGRATFVGQSGDALIQSTTPDAVEFFLNEGETAADHPVVATSLGAIDAITNAGMVVQAMVISPVFGLQGADFGAIDLSINADMDELRSQLEAQMEAAGQGIPPYFGGIIADIQNERPALVMSLVYPDCDIARTAADLIVERWTAAMAEIAPASVESGTREGVDGLCSAAVVVTLDSDAPESNPLSRAMMSAFMNRQFSVLQIGEASP